MKIKKPPWKSKPIWGRSIASASTMIGWLQPAETNNLESGNATENWQRAKRLLPAGIFIRSIRQSGTVNRMYSSVHRMTNPSLYGRLCLWREISIAGYHSAIVQIAVRSSIFIDQNIKSIVIKKSLQSGSRVFHLF